MIEMKKRTISLVLAVALLLTLGLSVASAGPLSQGEAYTIVAGDSLSKIAEKYLGDPAAWPAIMAATNAKHIEDPTFARIENADLVFPGQKVWVPTKGEAEADGLWCYAPDVITPIEPPHPVPPPGKAFMSATYASLWTGFFSGASADTGLIVAHVIDPGPPPIAAPMLFIGTSSFTDVEVGGVSGGLEMDAFGDKRDATSDWRGTWVITSGTGDLEGLRAHGTFWGPGWLPPDGGTDECPDPMGVIYYSVE